MSQVVLEIDKQTFEDMVRFIIKAVKEGIPEDEIWATLEILSSSQLQASINQGEEEIREGKARRFKTADEALEWLRS
jgi:phage terminase small subunit